MKRFKIFAIFILVLAIFAGCGTKTTEPKPSSQDGKTVIQILVAGYDAGYLNEALDAGIAKYEDLNPDVKIEVVSAGWDEINQKIIQVYQAGQSPDIIMLGSRSIRQFAEMGILEDMTPFLDEEYMANRIPEVMETANIDGKQYGIPLAMSSRALYYRSDLIENPPTTWEELLETAKAVNEEHGIYGFSLPTDIEAGTDEILNFIFQGGGLIVDEAGDFIINSPENVITLDYLKEFVGIIPDPVGTARKDQVDLFTNGDLAMYISGPWEFEKMDEHAGQYPYAVSELPVGKIKSRTIVTDSYGLSSISENKEIAADFIKFMGEHEQQSAITGDRWFPVTYAEENDEKFKDEKMKPFLDILADGVPEPKVPNWDDFNKEFLIAVQKTLTGELTAQEALDQCQAALTK